MSPVRGRPPERYRLPGVPQRPSLPKVARPPLIGKGPREVLPLLREEGTGLPPPPADFIGTLPEWAVYWALTRLGYRDGEDFTFQSGQLGPRWERGTAVVDFLILRREPNMCIRVQGMYWHYEQSTGRQAKDSMQRQQLEQAGLQVVDIDESDAVRAPRWYTEEALRGIDHSLGRQMAGVT